MSHPKLPPAKEKVAVSVYLPKDILKRLDAAAAREERSRSKLVELAVRLYTTTATKAAA